MIVHKTYDCLPSFKKVMKMPFFISAILILAVFSSCRKDRGDAIEPSITISSPAENIIYADKDTVILEGVVTGRARLKEIELVVTDITRSSKVFEKSYSTGEKDFRFREIFIVETEDPVNFEFEVRARNESGRRSSLKRYFHAIP